MNKDRRQEMFDTAAKGLLSQDEKALMSNNTCAYRAPNGLRCAIGFLIPDEHYQPLMEFQTVRGLIRLFQLDDILGPIETGGDVAFLAELQNIHDRHSPNQWAAELRRFASLYNLDSGVVDDTTKGDRA